MPFCLHRGARLWWREDGLREKPALLLLNAIGTNHGLWDFCIPALLPHFHLLRMDGRGHGASDTTPGDYTLELLAADAAAVLDAAGKDSAAICGISLGGMVAMEFALLYPGRTHRLALACTSAALDPAVWQTRIDTVRADGIDAIVDAAMTRYFGTAFPAAHPEIVAGTRAALRAQNPLGDAACGAAIRDMNLLARLGGISVPTLVIGGTQDVSTPFDAYGARIAAAIPQARHALLDAAHLPSLDRPGALADALIDALT